MKTNRGKGYFYAMGQRDGDSSQQDAEMYQARIKSRGHKWVLWAAESYYCGYWGLGS